ncbi:WLM-domain-containing protein [Auriculariales sp. MPI-PUGE-AT-0066]|nr:WLM-domain-containing protein [Auriculariales sp. MPI-PUGE-AT-0066]
MGHHRINERESNPNDQINFISALPCRLAHDEEVARQLLRALAAQVKPVMKSHGFQVNSFEEYEHNQVFLGRNWNAGETIEIVLRRANSSFYHTGALLNTLCHELAHIKYMDHSTRFHALWAQLRREVEELRAGGYFGDGMWSAGHRLGDGEQVLDASHPSGEDDPEYICGGAQQQSRRVARRKLYRQRQPKPGRTGAQTEKRGKPGRRIRGDADFQGGGTALNGHLQGSAKERGTGFRKQAGSKSAREARAAAAERRLAQLAVGPSSSADASQSCDDSSETDDDGEDDEPVQETNDERRQLLLASLQAAGEKDDRLRLHSTAGVEGASSSTCRPNQPSSSSTHQASPRITRLESRGRQTTLASHVPAKRKAESMLNTEIAQRKREFIGLDQSRVLGQGSKSTPRQGKGQAVVQLDETASAQQKSNTHWVCSICTLENRPLSLVCDACLTVRPD